MIKMNWLFSRTLILVGFLVFIIKYNCHAQDVSIIFPADAGVYNVQDYGAIPDDGKDDLSAILTAMDAAGNANHIIYFPDGVYDVSGTIKISPTDQSSSNCGTCHKRVINTLDFA